MVEASVEAPVLYHTETMPYWELFCRCLKKNFHGIYRSGLKATPVRSAAPPGNGTTVRRPGKLHKPEAGPKEGIRAFRKTSYFIFAAIASGNSYGGRLAGGIFSTGCE